MPRKRPRKTVTSQIKTVLQAFKYQYADDMDAFDSMILSLPPGEGVRVKNGRLVKIHFDPKRVPRIGEKLNW